LKEQTQTLQQQVLNQNGDISQMQAYAAESEAALRDMIKTNRANNENAQLERSRNADEMQRIRTELLDRNRVFVKVEQELMSWQSKTDHIQLAGSNEIARLRSAHEHELQRW
jgi:hypothetical protein